MEKTHSQKKEYKFVNEDYEMIFRH